MRTVRIKFVDFFPAWDINNNIIVRALKKYYDVQICDSPDYLFYSCFGDDNLNYDCVKIFLTGEDISPDFNLCDYAIGFDCMEFGDRYLRYPLFAYGKRTELACEARRNALNSDYSSKGFCSFVVSNGSANPVREEFFRKLSEYKQVASGGRYLNNVGGPVEDKIEFQSGYKFCIAFENDSSDGYTSEKIVDAYISGAVPVYWGNKRIAEDFNPDSFINCHDFESLDEAVEYVKKVDGDPGLYRKILSESPFAGDVVPEKFTPAALEKFLCSVIEKPLGEAKRISSYSRKKDYLSTQKEKAAIFRKMHHNPVLRILYKISKRLHLTV